MPRRESVSFKVLNMKRVLSVFLILLLSLSLFACTDESTGGADVPLRDTENEFTDNDKNDEYSEDSATVITLSGSDASINGGGAVSSLKTVTISGDGVFIIRGSYSGTLVVDASSSAKPHIILDSVSVFADTGATIMVKECDKAILTVKGECTLTGGEEITLDGESVNGAIWSKADLSLNGDGSLKISNPYGHGIRGKDDVVILDLSLDITSSSHGVRANDSVRIQGASLDLACGMDGIHAENSTDSSLGYVYIDSGEFKISSEGDGISAGADLQINSGSFGILAGGGYENGEENSSGSFGGMPGFPRSTSVTSTTEDSTSMKGIKCGGALLINGGEFDINSADDSLHTNSSATLHDGSFVIKSGDDGIHADDTLEIRGGAIDISKSYEGLEGVHISILSGNIKIKASDDGINAAGGVDSSGGGGRDGMGFGGTHGGSSSDGSVTIAGGEVYINASGDGIDANGTLLISGGYVTVCGPTSGDTAVLDYDVSGTITGGVFVGTGAYMMAQTFTDSEQGVLAVRVGSVSAGTKIELYDKKGNLVISATPELAYQLIILSTPDMESGEEYTIYVGDLSGTFEAM